MVELFAVYALLLAGWGLWRAHARRTEPDADAPAPAQPAAPHERGAAARRHLGTLP